MIKVYEDGDLGVYKHEGKGEVARKSVEDNYSKVNTSAGGKKMGESLHELSFVNQSLFNEEGIVKEANIKIDFESSELTDRVSEIINMGVGNDKYSIS